MSDNFQIPDLAAFSLHVTVHVAEDNLPAFFEAMKPVFDRVAAEPECLYFEIFQDPAEPGKISWVENWNASPQWLFDVQLQKEYYKPYFAATLPMYVKEREFRILKRLGPEFLVQKSGNLE
ncbi:Putative antibiotic biosynthesis monooxygenase domain-containing protein [Septoria linicola]|uniref:Antibiotic biosynthesis monooxygenase domain-containing protein n=1 Tax=Septoria linicola TaxID=215465 RepID=A0A9Q9EQT8_9PEZI|nr:putative antibiotic biosynthesis monooxygenase domain-containing protein [Septoria linicola]USW59460.1 Putative antibiotic biosynthesis monooxygenase domain-containing protein [Septoria linicola]